jgi:hypothetical protein
MRAFAAIVAAVLVMHPIDGRAQLPDTPAAHAFSGWLAAFNTGSRDSIRAFYEQHYPSAVGRVDQLMSFRDATGGFDFLKAVESTPSRFVAYVQERGSDQFAQATTDVDTGPPHNVTRLTLQAIERPAAFAPR